MAEMMEFLMDRSEKHEHRLNNDNSRHEKLIEESFRRLEDKLNSGTDSFTKTINTYFTETNQKVAGLDSDLNTLKRHHESKFEDVNSLLLNKVSENNLKAALESV